MTKIRAVCRVFLSPPKTAILLFPDSPEREDRVLIVC